jgi:hydrogenase maturation protein HypF
VPAPVVEGSDGPVRYRLRVKGVVQGVGFRPFVHRLAADLHLAGLVGNDTEGVFVEIEGSTSRVDTFERRLMAEKPPMARIDAIDKAAEAVTGDRVFRIVQSRSAARVSTFVSPDAAACDDCLAEMSDPSDRRFRYPFINCTNCGPRFTITTRLPYDRSNTTMRGFAMCEACAIEYQDPADRRYHAQPVACERCGPRVWFDTTAGVTEGTDAVILAAQNALAHGEIVAVKGLGGFHLACDATIDSAVANLRDRKGRAEKPFAVMVRDLESARSVAHIDGLEASLLVSPQRPIVLLRRQQGAPVASAVAPGSPLIGVLLPYTPLHHLLFQPVPGSDTHGPECLVMTSGNLTDEPICYEDQEARQRLGAIADSWLLHDRPIHVPCDDSVVRVVDGHELPIRRSRGYAPLPVNLSEECPPVLAVGGELKNTFCIASGHSAWMSQHIGDMGSVETLAAFERSSRQFSSFYQIDPATVVADSHPGYHTTQWAQEAGLAPVVSVQHHHAHVAAAMAEHNIGGKDRVIGIAFDGTGYGDDGAIWGGEVLLAGYSGFERLRHLRYVPLPGGDSAVRKPYRAALSHLWAAGIDWSPDLPPVEAAGLVELELVRKQLEGGVRCVPTSSMGRLFDAVSSLLGIRQVVSYEAQAAMEMEALADEHSVDAPINRFVVTQSDFDPGPVLRSLVAGVRDGLPAGRLAAGFHLAVAHLIGEVASMAREESGIETVVLTGGVFQNAILASQARKQLEGRDFLVLSHRLVPPNDGGIALGQVAVASHRQAER